MVVKYYQVREGKLYVNGEILEVKVNGLEISVESITDSETEILALRESKGRNFYALISNPSYVPREGMVNVPGIGLTPNVLKIGEDTRKSYEFSVARDGTAYFSKKNMRRERIYAQEISEKNAKKLAAESREWRMMQAWI